MATGGELRLSNYSHDALIGPAGWLPALDIGDLMGVRFDHGTVRLEQIDPTTLPGPTAEQAARTAIARNVSVVADTPETEPRDCALRRYIGNCQMYWPGHDMHWIHARHVGRSPWGWRDGTVSAIEGLWVTIRYAATDRSVRGWHHEPLAADLDVGFPVRVHEGYHALDGPFGWVNVFTAAGPGPVPEPADTTSWAAERSWPVTGLRTGRTLPTDRSVTRGGRHRGRRRLAGRRRRSG